MLVVRCFPLRVATCLITAGEGYAPAELLRARLGFLAGPVPAAEKRQRA